MITININDGMSAEALNWGSATEMDIFVLFVYTIHGFILGSINILFPEIYPIYINKVRRMPRISNVDANLLPTRHLSWIPSTTIQNHSFYERVIPHYRVILQHYVQ